MADFPMDLLGEADEVRKRFQQAYKERQRTPGQHSSHPPHVVEILKQNAASKARKERLHSGDENNDAVDVRCAINEVKKRHQEESNK